MQSSFDEAATMLQMFEVLEPGAWLLTFVALIMFSLAMWLVDHAGDANQTRILAERLPDKFNKLGRNRGYATGAAFRESYTTYFRCPLTAPT